MSRGNVDALRRVYEQMAQGNFWAAREIFHPEITWKWSSSMSGLTGVDTYHGIEGVEAATRDQFVVWTGAGGRARSSSRQAMTLSFSPACMDG